MGEAKRVYKARHGVEKSIITEGDRVTFLTRQDVEPILDGIKRDRETMTHSGPNKLAARIPEFLYDDLVRRGIIGDEDAFKVWLNSSEAAPWRIWQGRL